FRQTACVRFRLFDIQIDSKTAYDAVFKSGCSEDRLDNSGQVKKLLRSYLEKRIDKDRHGSIIASGDVLAILGYHSTIRIAPVVRDRLRSGHTRHPPWY